MLLNNWKKLKITFWVTKFYSKNIQNVFIIIKNNIEIKLVNLICFLSEDFGFTEINLICMVWAM